MKNPFLNARTRMRNIFHKLSATLTLWQAVTFISLAIALIAVAGVIHIGSQSKFIPLVFQQDANGNTLSVTRADVMTAPKIADYRTAVADFISNIRLVTPDIDLQRKAILQTYAYLQENDAATMKANEYLNGNKAENPFNRAMKETVTVDIQSVLQQSPHTWQIEWQETIRNRDGSLHEPPYLMRALVNVYQMPPTNKTSEVEELRNPHLIFIRDFNWSRA